MTKHTQSPWCVWGQQNDGNVVLLCHEDGSHRIVPVDLAAGALDLLVAAKLAYHVLENFTTEEFRRDMDKPARDVLAAAIAKAEGKPE